MWKKALDLLKRPTSLGLAGTVGIAVGIIGWGGFNTAMEATNSLEFCISCHEMRNTVFEEYKKTIHYSNPAGVRAICSDCHVPKDWTHKIVRKVQASKELWGKVTGYIDTPEKFEEHRLELAKHEWARMKASDSRECRNCHSFEAMDFAHQKKKEASDQMQKAWKEGGTCIDCHKGIAHKLPDMTTGYKSIFSALVDASKGATYAAGDKPTSLVTKGFWLEKPASESAAVDGRLLAPTPVEVLARDGDFLKVKISGWQQEGAERMLYALQGKRIFVAALGSDTLDKVEHGKTMTDPDTEQKWTEASLGAWISSAMLTRNTPELESFGAEMYNASCGLCHAAPQTGHYLANQWIGNLNAMKRFVALDDEQFRFLQKWVQLNAGDTGGHK
ncbi:NapC/NirT family cytochrome c [Pinisolibacter aquiterrae]|uniref:NapC/NirT family cytochrome c n=1 Tax=Pinisolibacter aquiterrae TaxID=2815579 RepID=UPI0030841DC4